MGNEVVEVKVKGEKSFMGGKKGERVESEGHSNKFLKDVPKVVTLRETRRGGVAIKSNRAMRGTGMHVASRVGKGTEGPEGKRRFARRIVGRGGAVKSFRMFPKKQGGGIT